MTSSGDAATPSTSSSDSPNAWQIVADYDSGENATVTAEDFASANDLDDG